MVLDTISPSARGWVSNLTSPRLRGERFLSLHYRMAATTTGTLRLEALAGAPGIWVPVWWQTAGDVRVPGGR